MAVTSLSSYQSTGEMEYKRRVLAWTMYGRKIDRAEDVREMGAAD